MRVKEKSEKVGLKPNIQKTKIIASGYITSWQIEEGKVKEESEKAGLKPNIQKTKIIAPSPIIPWQINGTTKETVTDFIFLGSKIIADGECSHEIKRCWFLEKKQV